MESHSSLLINWLVLFFLILVHAFFTMCEVSIITLNDNKVKKMAQDGDKKAEIIVRLTSRPSEFLATMQLGSTLTSFFMAAIVIEFFFWRYIQAWQSLVPNIYVAKTISVLLVTLAFLLLSIVFGDMVPRRLAIQRYEKAAFAMVSALYCFSVILRPLAAMFSFLSNGILRLLGIDPDSEPEEVTEEEIRMLVDVGGERGSIEESEKEMINNIFEFDDRTVDDMMTHRTEIVFIEKTAPLNEIIDTALKSGYSRIPVCEENSLDSIAGILYVKDLLSLIPEDDADFSLKNYMREPLYVLESNTCMAVLSEFKSKKIQMAIVVDEYGGTSGLVTMEDLLESIVGNIQDEYDDEDDEILRLSENRFLVDGLTSLDDIDKYFNMNLSQEAEFDTIGGYIIDRLGRIPAEDEHPVVEIGGYKFIVSEMDERRVVSLEAEKLEPLEEDSQISQ